MNSYHLLLCCLDLLYSNALFTRNRRELLNPNFEGNLKNTNHASVTLEFKDHCFQLFRNQLPVLEVSCAFTLCVGLPQDFGNRDFRVPADVPCIVERLCNRHQGTVRYSQITEFVL